MATNDYAFVTEWRLEAPRELLFEILLDGEQFPRWWPEVYLSAEATPAPAGGEFGRTVRLHT